MAQTQVPEQRSAEPNNARPTAASADKGARLLDHMAGRLVQLLAEVEVMLVPVSQPRLDSSP